MCISFSFANPISFYHPPRIFKDYLPSMGLGYFQAHPTVLTHHELLSYQQPITAPYSPPAQSRNEHSAPPPVPQPPQEQQAETPNMTKPELPANPSATNTTIHTSECITVCPVSPPTQPMPK